MEYKVRLSFLVGSSTIDIIVSGHNENDVAEQVGNMIKNGEIFCREGPHKEYFNMAHAHVNRFRIL